MRQIWGGSAEIESEELVGAVEDLQADLQALVHDFRRGPVTVLRDEVAAYLLELRREFLRPYRRLHVHIRTSSDPDEAQDALRRELAELAGGFRAVVLSRSSRIQHDGWHPEAFAEGVRLAVEALPRLVSAPVESQTFESRDDDGWRRGLHRRFVRMARWLRTSVGREVLERPVELRELARYHLQGRAMAQVEGLAALFVQAEAQLVGRSRQLVESVAQGFEAFVAHIEQGDLPDMLSGLRIQLDDEFSSVQRDVHAIIDDSVHRAETILGDALQSLKDELPIIATLDLPTSQRRSLQAVNEANRVLLDVDGRLERLRDHVGASYALLALHLELIGFRSRLQHTMDEVLSHLRADVRGRSRVQLERVRGAVDEVLLALSSPEAEAPREDADVRTVVGPLEHVVEEATAVARQLLDQLSAETAVAPLLETLNREAQSLTNRYEVPATAVPRAEWKLPPAAPSTEIDFAAVVSSFVQREVAPELLAITNGAVSRVGPILDVFQDLERVVSFDAEVIDDHIDASTAPAPQLAELMMATLRRGHETLTARLEDIAYWDESLVVDIRRTVLAKLDELRLRFSDGQVARIQAVRRPDARLQWGPELARIAAAARGLRKRVVRSLRSLMGEARLQQLWGQLGLPESAPAAPDSAAWAYQRRRETIPVFYRRLFGGQARWAGDVLNVPDAEVQRLRDALTTAGPGPKTVALIGADAASRGALANAVIRGSKTPRRLMFTHPPRVEELETALADVVGSPFVHVSGLAWLLTARPGGQAPLDTLLKTIVREPRRSAWLLEVDALAWDFATTMSPLADVFARRLRVRSLTVSELEQAILARHHLSGYSLRFELFEQSESLESERRSLRDHYFQALHAACGGLLTVALTMWLSSIVRVDESETLVVIGSEPRDPLVGLRRLPESTWTTLFVVARQGWMDVASLSFVLQIEFEAAEGQLTGLVGAGLLERQGRDIFVIKRHLRGAVIAGLREKGWLP